MEIDKLNFNLTSEKQSVLLLLTFHIFLFVFMCIQDTPNFTFYWNKSAWFLSLFLPKKTYPLLNHVYYIVSNLILYR